MSWMKNRLLVTALRVALIVCGVQSLAALPAHADPHETSIELHDGRIHTSDFSLAVCRALHVSDKLAVNFGQIDLAGVRGSTFVTAMNGALGDGCSVQISDDRLLLHVDFDRLPRDCDTMKKATRVFTALAAPQWTAEQAEFYGLKLDTTRGPIDASKPLVILVHGLDCDRANWASMAELLEDEGHQVAYFTYPSDQPIDDSAVMLGREIDNLRKQYPSIKLDFIAHSMGGLVARDLIEGDSYPGNVDHLILLGTPNAGSTWSKYRLILEAQEHYHLWKHEPKWHWTWMLTDGLGEAARDLKPGSEFLKQLNELPRRDGVKYTIVAGSQHPAARITGNCLEGTSNLINGRVAKWWGFRQTKAKLADWGDQMIHDRCKGDGPVRIKSTRLNGVDDFVVVESDHASLYMSPGDGEPPVAWSIIRDRLAE